jgi:hypothetical protein
MAILDGVKPSELDAATIAALQIAIGGDAGAEMMYGQGLVNIKRKLNNIANYGKPASSIRIAIFADSIFASSTLKSDIINYFNDNWAIPEANIDVSCCFGGYDSASYIVCLDGGVIKPNVDLFIFSENEDYLLDQIVAKVRATTNADIMFGTWSLKEDTGFPRFTRLLDIAKKYNCEVFDINGLLMRKYLDGTYLTYMLGANNVHLSEAGADYIFADFEKHFYSDRYYNEYVNPDTIRETFLVLGAEKMIPINGITFSGTWAVQGAFSTVTKANSVRSSTATDYIEFTFVGVGFEMLFLDSGTQNNHTILVDGAAPSAYAGILEYCTTIIGKTFTDPSWSFHRFFAAQVTAPFMTNDEEEVEFEITIDSITRDGGGIATAIDYTLRQGVDVLGTGDIFTDATFTFRVTGEITIPALVYETPNYLEGVSPYIFTAGDTMQFFARKTWKDTIDTNAETFLRIAGLTRASHTVRITKDDNVATDAVYLSLYK